MMSIPSNNSQMHNDIMAAGSRECPLMLAPAVLAVGDEPGQPHVVQEETYANTSPENKKLIDAEAKAIHMILNGISDDIYSIVDACSTTREMWLAIEHLQQGETINKQDVKTKLFWKFDKFTSRDGESIESYYTRFYRMMNEMIQKSLALISKNFINVYKPTNNNLKTTLKTRNKNVDTSPRTGNERNTMQFGNKMTVTVAVNRETVENQVVQQSGIQCLNCKGFGHFAKECKKPKRVKDYEYCKEKMMLCKQEARGVLLSEVLTTDSRPTYDVEPLENVQSDNDYNVFAIERQHSKQPESIIYTYVVEIDDSNVIPDSSDMSDNEGNVTPLKMGRSGICFRGRYFKIPLHKT
ncbi:retrovirus-related pol polyprotein from transposon TNT 1-94 [Tanacetum coccineum]